MSFTQFDNIVYLLMSTSYDMIKFIFTAFCIQSAFIYSPINVISIHVLEVIYTQVNKKLLYWESDFGCRNGGAKSKETRHSTINYKGIACILGLHSITCAWLAMVQSECMDNSLSHPPFNLAVQWLTKTTSLNLI